MVGRKSLDRNRHYLKPLSDLDDGGFRSEQLHFPIPSPFSFETTQMTINKPFKPLLQLAKKERKKTNMHEGDDGNILLEHFPISPPRESMDVVMVLWWQFRF